MLVLSRKQGEVIIINDTIRLQVIRVAGNTVRLGIQAPSGVRVLRGELLGQATESAPPAEEAAPAGR
jgi:carbon storage regulator